MKRYILLFFTLFLIACAGKKDYVVLESSASKRPSWLNDAREYTKEKYKVYKGEGDDINKRLCEKNAIANVKIAIAGEISVEIDNLFSSLTESQKEDLLVADTKQEKTAISIKQKLVGVELDASYWEKKHYKEELGSPSNRVAYTCYQLASIKKDYHDVLIKELVNKQLKNIKDTNERQEVKKVLTEEAEENNIYLQ